MIDSHSKRVKEISSIIIYSNEGPKLEHISSAAYIKFASWRLVCEEREITKDNIEID